MQEILDKISPNPVSEPKEEARPQRFQNRKVFRGFDYKVTPQVAQRSLDPYNEFLDALEEYKKIPNTNRSQLSLRFAKRVMDFSRMTPAHMHQRLIPCIKRLDKELDKILNYDTEKPNLRFRAKYTTEKAIQTVHQYEDLIKELGLLRKTSVISCEMELSNTKNTEEKPKKVKTDSQYEVIANFTPRQLNSLYALRGNARRSLVDASIKEKAQNVFFGFFDEVKNDIYESDELVIDVLRAAQRSFIILSNDQRSYAIVQGR
ncbi:hypothetical protein GPJ56_001164 [Histomonas meleagridis]|uniref:uncharacterized protein n=1 Tax=Histomonas meleagridis TaxID=135588 RepID=UPI0035598376|nr:hypothetical protein GPJ56_001164 [Histomonas meleagridis]KAH0799873.1 hypothetical protein GO595_006985 [Histomonas meleagridis]